MAHKIQASASSADPTTLDSTPIYDLVCVGFGAAQLATAVAIQESQATSKVLFFERKPSFSWHAGPHMSRTRMENPFVYDLATVRNPRSAFSYVNYLLAQKRLIEFANSDRLNPLREEFEDYLRWCAAQFKQQVEYNTEVLRVVPELKGDVVHAWIITVRGGKSATHTIRARNVVAPFPSGQSSPRPQAMPHIDFLAGQRIIAMHEYNSRRNELRGTHDPRLNIAVVGSTSQTTEILEDLLSCPRLGNITVVTEDESLACLRILGEQEPPPPRLCSIWAKPSCRQKDSITESSELIQKIYMRAYEKQVASKGEFGLHVIIGKDTKEACQSSHFIIRDTAMQPLVSSDLLQDLDSLVLGCRTKGDSLDEVQFKRGAVAEDCRMFLMSTRSDGGRTLSKDVATMAGQVAKAVSSVTERRNEGRVVQARM